MPLTDIEKAALPKSDIRAVHTALDGEHRQFSRDDDTPLGSVKARLEQAWPDSLAEGQLIKDDEGRDQLQAMPKATRSSMFPDPWRTNPVGRFWDRLRGRDVTPRYLSRLTKEEQASEQKWRTVGTIRRYILLLLTLAQTVGEQVNPEAIRYLNRLSDFLFVASRWANDLGGRDVPWVPGQNRE